MRNLRQILVVAFCKHGLVKPKALRTAPLSTKLSIFCGSFLLLNGISPLLTGQPAPEATKPAPPLYNVARSAVGTSLFYLDQTGNPLGQPTQYIRSPAVLVGDDEVLTYQLQSGRSLMLVELPAPAPVRHLTFFNFGARGQATASWAASRADADAGRWTNAQPVTFDRIGPVTAHLPDNTAFQFVRIELNVDRPGRISGLGLAGFYPNASAPSPSNLIPTTNTELPLTNVVSYGSTAAVVGSSPAPNQNLDLMIDDLTDTYTDLSPSRSPRAVLLDLGEAREIRQISILADSPPGDAKVFFISDPDSIAPALGNPAQGSASPPLVLTNVNLDRLERDLPFITLTIRPGQPGVTLPIQPRTSRFALVVWPAGTENIRVYEINLLGRYEWIWKPDALGAPAEGFQVQPGSFSPGLSGTPPPVLDGTPLSP